jgi:hypothetical protein
MSEDVKIKYQKDTLEVSEIKDILGCGINQAYALVNSDAFRVLRVGKKIKIPKDSFYGWYNGQGQK